MRAPRRDFNLLWTGQSVSLVGDQFVVLALPLFAVAVLGVSAADAAFLRVALFLPFLLIGLPAGAIVDRLPRRAVLMIADTVQAACYLGLVALAALDALPFSALLGIVGVSGCAIVFFQVAYTSYVPELVDEPRELQRGNSRLFLSESVSLAVGPLLAGPVIAVAGPVAALAANAGSFVVSLGCVASIRRRPAPDAAPRPRERGWLLRDVREGLRFVVRHPLLEPVILCGAVYVLFLSVVEASLILYCHDELGLGAIAIGAVIGSSALGFPLGNLISTRLVERFGIARALVAGAVTAVIGLAALPVAGALGSVVGLVIAGVVHGTGEGTFGPASLTLRQTASPAHLLGRVNAVQRFVIWGATPVGALLAALCIGPLGLGGALWIGGCGTVLCLIPLLRRGVRAELLAAFRGHSLTDPVLSNR
jgi:MFS family permease